MKNAGFDEALVENLFEYYKNDISADLTEDKMYTQSYFYLANSYFGSCDSPLCAAIDALLGIMKDKPFHETFLRNFTMLSSECGFWLPMQEMVFVSDRPERSRIRPLGHGTQNIVLHYLTSRVKSYYVKLLHELFNFDEEKIWQVTLQQEKGRPAIPELCK